MLPGTASCRMWAGRAGLASTCRGSGDQEIRRSGDQEIRDWPAPAPSLSSLLRLPEPLHQGLVLVLEDSVENSSNGLIFMKKRAKNGHFFSKKTGGKWAK